MLIGTLDILSAFIHYYFVSHKTDFLSIFQFIASAIYGKAAFTGGTKTIIVGALSHYTIALGASAVFFLLYPRIAWLRKNKIAAGILYGIGVWVVTNWMILPITHIAHRVFHVSNALINIGILIGCIGLPLSFIAAWFYSRNAAQTVSP